MAVALVAAPAGFGKSTLLLDWYERLGRDGTVAWLSLDEGDNDPDQLSANIGEALRRALDLESLGGGLSLEATAIDLINRLAGTGGDFVLFLDDYHVIEEPAVHAALTLLIDHQPSNLHLVIGTRRDPPLPLARLRVRARLLEVGADDLRFSPEETEEFLTRLSGETLSGPELEILEQQTEGWAAALQLAALSLRRTHNPASFIEALGDSSRFVFDYLAEEVFANLDGELQRFLLRTSILDRLSGPLCDSVTGMEGGAARLEELYRANVFTSRLGGKDSWYRYHHLFQDFLRRLFDEREPDAAQEMELRASKWFAAQGFLDEALPHAFASADQEWSLALVERGVPNATMRGEILTPGFGRWLGNLPPEVIERRPRLALPTAFFYVMSGRVSQAERLTSRVKGMLDGSEPAPHPIGDDELRNLRATLAVAEAYIARYKGEAQAAKAIAERMMAALSPDEPSQAWLGMIRQLVLYEAWEIEPAEIDKAMRKCFDASHLGGALALMVLEFYRLVFQGRLEDAEEHLARSLDTAYERQALPSVGMLHGVKAELLYERGELDEAEDESNRCLSFGAPGATPGLFVPPEATLARVQIVDGRVEDARASLRSLEQRARPVETVQGLRFYPALIAHIRLLMGDVRAAERWAESSGLDIQTEQSFLLEYPLLVLTRVFTATGRHQEAITLATRLRNGAEAHGRRGRALEAALLEACSRFQAGQEREAIAAFRGLMPQARRERYARTLLDEGLPVISMLQALLSDADLSSYAADLLRLAGAEPSLSQRQLQSGPDALSERELDVLRQLGQGLTNREIAEDLIVSLDTVKTHLKSIYAKLGAHSRTQALLAARERNLI